jgi:hypothetical protein
MRLAHLHLHSLAALHATLMVRMSLLPLANGWLA